MLRWGVSAWDNRAAANWFATVCEAGKPVPRIIETLHLDVVEYPEEVRAAAAMLLLLVEAGRWPDGTVESGLELAISRLEEICDKRVLADDPAVLRATCEDACRLRSRLLRSPAA